MEKGIRNRQPVLAFLPPLAIVVAVALIVAACEAWSRGTLGPAQRTLVPAHAWGARSGGIGLWAAGHAVLFAVAIPAVYRSRPVYTFLAALCGLTATVAGVAWAALHLARA